jgi:hypothetical protein
MATLIDIYEEIYNKAFLLAEAERGQLSHDVAIDVAEAYQQDRIDFHVKNMVELANALIE